MSTAKDPFKVLWEDAVAKYEKSIRRTLSEPAQVLLKQLETPENLAEHVEREHKEFITFRRRSNLASRLKVVAKPIIALSNVAQSAIGLSPFAPAAVIFGATVYLVQATNGVSDAYDWVEDLFDKLGDFIVRISQYCESRAYPPLRAKIVEILGCLLEILSVAEKAIRQGRWKRYAKVVFLGTDDPIRASFDRLEKLSRALDGLVLTIDFATNQRVDERTDEISKTGKETLEIVKRTEIAMQQNLQGKLQQDLLDWLSPTDFRSLQEDLLAGKEKDTGQWFLHSPEFNRWIGGPKQIIFCTGMPGAGKTMMAAIAIDQLFDQVGNESNGIVFAYCRYTTAVDKQANTILSAMLRQLVQQRPSIPEHVLRLYEDKSKKQSKLSPTEVFSTLQLVLKDYLKVYVVVDALDECMDENGIRPQLLKSLHSLQSEVDLRLMITSRFTTEVEEEFGQVPKLEVQASDDDVKRFIAGQIHQLPKCVRGNENLRSSVRDKIADAADGMFLLARLYVDSLVDTTTERQVTSVLENVSKNSKGAKELPQVYDKAYDKAIKRIDSQPPNKRGLARKVLSWITYAQRALTIRELCHALAVELGEKELHQDNIPVIEDVVSVCAGLVTVDEKSNVIRLVHHTTQEYLERVRLEWNPGAQKEIALACLTYLSFNTFRSGSSADDKAFEQRLAENAFFDYSAHYWSEHVRPVESTTSYLGLAFLCDEALVDCTIQAVSPSGYKWAGYSKNFPDRTSGLCITARYGLLYLTECLLTGKHRDRNIGADSKDSYSRTPLSWAAQCGHEAVAKLLVERDDVAADSQDKEGRTPLLWAAAGGHEAVVKLLVERDDVDADSRDKDGRTPLSWAADIGYEAVVKLLKSKYSQIPNHT